MTGGVVTPIDLDKFESGDAESLLAYATGMVRGYCGWHIAPSQDQVATFTAVGGSVLVLPTLHLTALTALTVTSDGVPTELDIATSVVWDTTGYLLRRGGCWPADLGGTVTVAFTHGYPDWPLEAKAVILSVAARAKASPSGDTRESAGPFAVTHATTAPGVSGGVVLLDHEQRVLDRYKLGPRP